MRLHSEWKFKFWTDKERDCPVLGMEKHLLQDFHFIHLQGLIDKTENYSEKSDILRFEILLQEGGLCVDPDVKCYHSFDNFHYGFDFYSALEKPNQDLGMDSAIAPAISIIGAKPGHPILRGTVELLKAYGNEEADFVNTPVKHAVNRTFKSFGEAAEANIDKGENIDIILPASFFFAWELFTAKEIKHLKKQNVVFARYFCSTEQAGSPEIEKETQLKNEQNARM
jgi:mannosyltransferase OCH1-like enzyme